jgi:UPF0176 protein
MSSTPIRIASLYQFGHIEDALARQPVLKALCVEHGVGGTLIVSQEGLNGTIAGPAPGVESVLCALRSIPGFEGLEHKEAWADETPFFRMKVHHKPEIVTMGVPSADPRVQVGQYVAPEDWNALISEPGVVLIDTRNHYESRIGSFEGATLPDTDSFRDFPAWVDDNEATLKAAPKIAMFCTGGIRCERATAYMLGLGYDEVFHLKGGVLKYLETVPEGESSWNGECFVFDQRVSVKHGLVQGDYDICYACREPISDEDKAAESYVKGVSCPLCVDQTTEEQKRNYAERHRQVLLAQARDQTHIGSDAHETG